MGVEFHPGHLSTTYGGFHDFRSKIVESLGYTMSYGDMIDNHCVDFMKDEPIYPLLNRSDCDGELTVEELKQILTQCQTVVNSWDSEDDIKEFGLEFIDSIEVCLNCEEPLVFC